jgi:hypothetical protein
MILLVFARAVAFLRAGSAFVVGVAGIAAAGVPFQAVGIAPLGIGPLLLGCVGLWFLVGGLRAGFGLVAFALGVGICIVALGVGFRLGAAAGSLAGLGVLIRRFRALRLVTGFFTTASAFFGAVGGLSSGCDGFG